jgi:hypothetical protein
MNNKPTHGGEGGEGEPFGVTKIKKKEDNVMI